MPENPHFESVASWTAAARLLSFAPLIPDRKLAHELKSLSVFVRDHKMRELPIGERVLEAHFSSFSFSQERKASPEEARHQVIDTPYGQFGQEALIAGHVGRIYELGPEPPADDVDGRSPSVVVWYHDDMFYLLASDRLPVIELVDIAGLLLSG